MLKKLRLKFVCIMMVIVTIMMCAIIGLMIGFTWENLERESLDQLQELATGPGIRPQPHENSSQLSYFTMVRDPSGTVQVSGTAYLDDYDQETLLDIWELVSSNGEKSGELKEYRLRYMRDNGPVGERYVFLDVSGQYQAMESMVQVSILVWFITFGIMLGLSILLAKWAIKPVETAWQQQRQFVADASHELKTPLTVIMTNAELLQSPEGAEESRQHLAGNILTMSRQMRGLVEGLLELARVDNGAVKMVFAQLELSALVMDGVLPFEALYFERGLSLDAGIEEGLRCKGSESHLRQVVEILMDNAMKYSTPGGCVRVQLRRQGSHALLSVASPGQEISPADQKNIFKRFYRIDKARSRDGSYGLGLSIAQSIVSEHRGRIWVESSGGINTFFVQLPLN